LLEPAEHAVVVVAHLFARIEEERPVELAQVLVEGRIVFGLQVLQDALLDVLVVRRFDLKQNKEQENESVKKSNRTWIALDLHM
jgi:hypothetical protein